MTAVDLPGHGRSEPDPDATPESFVDAVGRSVPRRWGVVVGHSMGGSIVDGVTAAMHGRRGFDIRTMLEAGHAVWPLTARRLPSRPSRPAIRAFPTSRAEYSVTNARRA